MILDLKADKDDVRSLLDELLDKMHEIQAKAKTLKEQQKELKVCKLLC